MTRASSREHDRKPTPPPLFDPEKLDTELFDTLAEQQADALPRINSSQLRRFFGEVKDLYRRFEGQTRGQSEDEIEQAYRTHFEPLFKMVRSKVSYATRRGGQSTVPHGFATFLGDGIGKVRNHRDFRRFVMHFEAVVGFMYGKDKVAR